MLQEYYFVYKQTVGVQANLPTNVFGFQWLIKPLLDDIDIYNMGVTISVFIEKYLFYLFLFVFCVFSFCFVFQGETFFSFENKCVKIICFVSLSLPETVSSYLKVLQSGLDIQVLKKSEEKTNTKKQQKQT